MRIAEAGRATHEALASQPPCRLLAGKQVPECRPRSGVVAAAQCPQLRPEALHLALGQLGLALSLHHSLQTGGQAAGRAGEGTAG